MKIKHFTAAVTLALASQLAAAATQYHVHETFYEGDVFDGLITFSDNFDAIASVQGTLLSPNASPDPKMVDGFIAGTYRTLAPNVMQVGLSGPDGFPGGYLLSLAWDYGSKPSVGLPIFITDSVYDPGTDQTYYFYSNSINGINYATSATISAVPEPASYAMLLAGLGLVALRRHATRKHTS